MKSRVSKHAVHLSLSLSSELPAARGDGLGQEKYLKSLTDPPHSSSHSVYLAFVGGLTFAARRLVSFSLCDAHGQSMRSPTLHRSLGGSLGRNDIFNFPFTHIRVCVCDNAHGDGASRNPTSARGSSIFCTGTLRPSAMILCEHVSSVVPRRFWTPLPLPGQYHRFTLRRGHTERTSVNAESYLLLLVK